MATASSVSATSLLKIMANRPARAGQRDVRSPKSPSLAVLSRLVRSGRCGPTEPGVDFIGEIVLEVMYFFCSGLGLRSVFITESGFQTFHNLGHCRGIGLKLVWPACRLSRDSATPNDT